MARFLFASDGLPYPPNAGVRQRTFHVLQALAAIGDVDLLCYADPVQLTEAGDYEPLRQLCREIMILDRPPERWPDSPRTYGDLFRRYMIAPRSFRVANLPGRPLASSVHQRAADADLVWVDSLELAEWMRLDGRRIIVDMDDIQSLREKQRLSLAPVRPYYCVLRFDNWRFGKLERTAPARYSNVVIASGDHRDFFPRRLRSKLLVVPNGITAGLLDRPRAESVAPVLVFVGSMGYEANLDAAHWFTREIFPRIEAAIPGVRLDLVGRRGLERLSALHDGRRVVVTGTVEDVASYVSRATVSVAPIRWGGGTRIKILEALALGTPVVSTTLGAEGLELTPGRHILTADSPERFAEAVIGLLRAPEARRALAAAGRARVAERYTWDRIGQDLATTIRERLAVSGAPSVAITHRQSTAP